MFEVYYILVDLIIFLNALYMSYNKLMYLKLNQLQTNVMHGGNRSSRLINLATDLKKVIKTELSRKKKKKQRQLSRAKQDESINIDYSKSLFNMPYDIPNVILDGKYLQAYEKFLRSSTPLYGIMIYNGFYEYQY